MSGDENTAGRHLIDQAKRCREAGDEVGAEVHLTAALERARTVRDPLGRAEALLALAGLRQGQRRGLAATAQLEEARALLESAEPGDPRWDAIALEAHRLAGD